MADSFRLRVDKNGLVFLNLNAFNNKSEKLVEKPVFSVRFVHPRMDGERFERCLKALRVGDVIEVRFLPFLPEGAQT
jgi:hypothetical protein